MEGISVSSTAQFLTFWHLTSPACISLRIKTFWSQLLSEGSFFKNQTRFYDKLILRILDELNIAITID